MTTIVIMPGGFHPFHAGHYALYQSAQRAFPDADVYVAATNDTSARPFPFPVKEKLAKLAGVEAGHFVQVKSPFKAEEITAKFDPARDTLIFVRSEKDSTKPPQPGGVKKDGSAGYLQPLLGAKKLEPFSKHAYMAYLPTVEFGPGMTSATEIRAAWPQLNEKRKTALVMSLYPRTQGNAKLAATVVKLLDTALGVVDESALDNLPRPNKRNQFKSLHKQRKQRGLDEQSVAEGYDDEDDEAPYHTRILDQKTKKVIADDGPYEFEDQAVDRAEAYRAWAKTKGMNIVAQVYQPAYGKNYVTWQVPEGDYDLKEQGVAEGSLNEFAPGGNSASSYYAVTANFVNDFAQQKQEELQDLIDAGWTKQDLAQAGTLQSQAADIVHFEQVRDGFLKGLKPGFDAYLQGDTQLKDQLGSYWEENDLPLNQDWEKIYGEPWGRDEYDEGVAESNDYLDE